MTFSDPITLSGPVDYITDEGFTLFHGLTQRYTGNVKAISQLIHEPLGSWWQKWGGFTSSINQLFSGHAWLYL
ncbi:TPA: hypothetical protein PFE09_002156 [Kluyvera ascorbata]|nr:hypothetical protein [Kluyvera ascorbata]